jgi:adenosylcobinamide-phosphate synthase
VLIGLTMPALALLLTAGVLLDLLLGEARRFHPLVGFGKLADALARGLNRGRWRCGRGVAAWLLAVVPLAALGAWGCNALGLAAQALMLYFCIGLRSLRDHNLPIAQALRAGDLGTARRLTARIVSRDTEHASPPELAKASAESLLENGNDAVFGTLFWFALAGGPGALLFRLANTLDAMWGYRSERWRQFGWAAARIDDALNFIPARLTALSYVALAPGGAARRRAGPCWRTQAPAWSSPNAGPVMASGAGALGLALGGAAVYDGAVEPRPPLGSGVAAGAHDIGRAWRLVARTTALWLVCAWSGAAMSYLAGGAHA